VRRQLVRVLGELASNMAKHAAPGSARIIVDSDGRSLEAMAANTAPAVAPGEADGAASSMPDVSSGLGLAGARRRVESLGGVFDATHTVERFTVILSVPLSR
jgi:putative signal transduction histidine kinase